MITTSQNAASQTSQNSCIIVRVNRELQFMPVDGAAEPETGLPFVTVIPNEQLRAAFSSEDLVCFDFDLPGAEWRHYSAIAMPERNAASEVHTVLLIVRDVTSERRAQESKRDVEQQLMLLVEASGTLLSSPHSEEVLHTIVGLAQRFVAADAHSVWGSDHAGNWRMLSSAGLSEAYLRYATIAASSAVKPLRAPLVARDVYAFPALRGRVEAYAKEAIRSLLVIPLLIHNEPSGTVAFYWREPHAISQGEIRIGQALANLAATALGAAHLYEREIESRERAQRSEQRSTFLAEAGALISSSLDYQTTLANVARLAVPGFADWCSVDVLDEKGRIQRVAIQHSNPAMLRLADEYRRKYPPREEDLSRTVLRSGQAAMIESISDEMLVKGALDAEHLGYLRKLGIASLILVPMTTASGESLGVLTFVRSDPARTYNAEDLRVAEEVGRRAGTGIAHSRLYGNVQASEERLRLAVNAAGLGVWERDFETGELTASDRCKANFGADPAQPLSYEDLVARIHPDDLKAWTEATQKAQESGDVFETEYRVRWPDGSLHTVLSYERALPVDPGQPRKTVGVTLDVTEQRASFAREQEARRTAELLNSVGPMLLSQLERDRLVQDIADVAAMLVGADFGALIYDFAAEAGAHPAEIGLSRGGQRRARKDPTFQRWVRSLPFNIAESRPGDVPAQPDAKHVGSLLLIPVRSRSGEALGSLVLGHKSEGAFDGQHERLATGIAAQAAIALDNARLFEESRRAREALQHSNEELRRANEDLNQFAYSASHDLQEPLRMVAIYSQMLQRRYAEVLEGRGAQYLDYAIQGAKRMEMLLKDLLTYTQAASASTGEVPLTDAGKVVEKALSNLQTSMEESGSRVHISELPEVRITEVHLLQVLQNLIGNAIKYRKPNQTPEIWIASESDSDSAVIRIRDNGIGIPEEYRQHIFGLFRRLHTSDQYPGTGIGLAICQRLIERYGGRIWVGSRPGEGSEFCFSLPTR